MKDLQHLSTQVLLDKKSNLCKSILEYERMLSTTKSILWQMSISHYIKKCNEQIHRIEAEICYREAHDKN